MNRTTLLRKATLFGHRETPHQVNWYVHRPSTLRKKLYNFWGNGPENKHTMQGASIEQMAVFKANQLFRMLENEGPKAFQSLNKFTLDTKHGNCNYRDDYIGLKPIKAKKSGTCTLFKETKYGEFREHAMAYNTKTKGAEKSHDLIPCISKGLYHAHMSDGRNSIVVLCQIFETQKLIHILDIATHENFDFGKAHDSKLSMLTSLAEALKSGFYDQDTKEAQFKPSKRLK